LQISTALWQISGLLQLALLARVLLSFRRLHWFAASLAAVVIQDLILMQLRYNSNLYFYVWLITTGVVVILQTAAAVEAFSNMLSEYRGIGSVVTALLTLALLLAAVTAAVLSGPDIRAIHELSRLVSIASAAMRVLSSVLVVFMLGGSYLFWFYRVPHRANDRRHLIMMICMMTIYSLMYFLVNFSRKYLALENTLFEASLCLCMVAWHFALRKDGELRPRSEIGSIDSHVFRQENGRMLKALRAARRF
jgi:hypothetical protein